MAGINTQSTKISFESEKYYLQNRGKDMEGVTEMF